MTIGLDLEGRPALVIGGGGGGIGTAMAVTLAEAGAHVGTITMVPEHAADTLSKVQALGQKAASAVIDVTDEKALMVAMTQITEDLGAGPLRHLANVVGGNLADDWFRTSEYDMDAFDRVVGRNLRYAVVACREMARGLISAETGGAIVNVSSVAARGAPLLAAYGASKAGLESFSRTMALEWAQYGIRVNLVAPDTIKTPRAGQSDLGDLAAQSIPLARRGTPSDISLAALFLLSDPSSYITGQVLTVDGGMTIAGGPGGDRLPAFVTNPAVRARFEAD